MNTSNNIVGLIPAAGKGSRLAPFPCPKELFPVGYQDYLVKGQVQRRPKVVSQYLFEHIIMAGAKRMLIILSEGKSDIMKYYGDGSKFGVDVCYLFQEELNGMPNALGLAENWIEGSTVIFGMPDTIIEPYNAFETLLKYHDDANADLTMGLFYTNTPAKFGMVATDNDDNVLYTIDKPRETELTTMWGCACWSPSFTKLLREFTDANKSNSSETVLGDVFNLAIERKMVVKGHLIEGGQYLDMGTADELDLALKKFHL